MARSETNLLVLQVTTSRITLAYGGASPLGSYMKPPKLRTHQVHNRREHSRPNGRGGGPRDRVTADVPAIDTPPSSTHPRLGDGDHNITPQQWSRQRLRWQPRQRSTPWQQSQQQTAGIDATDSTAHITAVVRGRDRGKPSSSGGISRGTGRARGRGGGFRDHSRRP